MPPTPIDQRDKNAAFPLIVEQFVCPSDFCGANIPQSHVVSSYPKGGLEPRRIVKTLCPACGSAHKATFALQGGVWHIIDNVQPLHTKERQAVQAHIDKVNRVAFAQSA